MRYRVEIVDFERTRFGYDVCTLHDEHKAVALAVYRHNRDHPKHSPFVVRVRTLPGDEPEGKDLVDRMEW